MTKTYLLELADYNIWANKKVINWLSHISTPQFEQPLVGSFKNIHETTLHIVAAEQIWQERLVNSVSEWLGFTFQGDKTLMLQTWEKTSNDLRQYILDSSDDELLENFDFSTRDGTASNMERYKALAHTFNHSTFHRGQLVTLLRQVGFTDVSSTDMINFYREN